MIYYFGNSPITANGWNVYDLTENLLKEFWKNIQDFFLYCVPGNMQVVWVSSEGFVNKEKIVFWKAIRRTWERMEEWNRWIERKVPWFAAAGT